MKNLICIISFLTILHSCKKTEDIKDPIIITTEVQNVSIHGTSDGSISVTVSGGKEPYSYLWSNGAVTKDLQNISAGIYVLTVTDIDGDSKTSSDTVSEPDILGITYEKTDVSVLGGSDGSISVTATGGISPYSFNWSNGAAQNSITGLSAGLYWVTVTDAAQAQLTQDIRILDPLSISISGNNASTYNGNNGSVDLQIAGGLEPYSVQWSNGSTVEDLNGVKAGFYKVTVTDANASVKQAGFTVYESFDIGTPEAALLEDVIRLQQSGIRIMYQGDQIIYIDPINLYEGHTGDAEIILITHSHADHYSPTVIQQLVNDQTVILCPPDVFSNVTPFAGPATILKIAPDSVKTVNGITIEIVPAYNSNHNLPNSVGYILTLDGLRFYHSGDTKRIPEMVDFHADIACLPMGQTYTFSSIEEAVDAARDIEAKVVLPIHYGMFEGTDQDPWTFKDMVSGEIYVCVKPSVIN